MKVLRMAKNNTKHENRSLKRMFKIWLLKFVKAAFTDS